MKVHHVCKKHGKIRFIIISAIVVALLMMGASAGPSIDIPSISKPYLPNIKLPDLTCPVNDDITVVPTECHGQTFNGTYAVLNKGAGNSKPFSIFIFILPDNLPAGTNYPLTKVGAVNVPSLAAKSEKKDNVEIHIPPDMTPGQYILEEIIDYGDVIVEVNESNNVGFLWNPIKIKIESNCMPWVINP